MKFSLTVLSLICCGCFASPVEKRSIYGGEWLSGYYGGLSTPSIAAPSISSHTHTHSTAIIDRPYPVAVQTPTYTSSSYLPSTFDYGLSSYGYPYGSSYPSIGYNKFYPSKYYARSYPTTIYKKSFYSSPLIKSYKW